MFTIEQLRSSTMCSRVFMRKIDFILTAAQKAAAQKLRLISELVGGGKWKWRVAKKAKTFNDKKIFSQ